MLIACITGFLTSIVKAIETTVAIAILICAVSSLESSKSLLKRFLSTHISAGNVIRNSIVTDELKTSTHFIGGNICMHATSIRSSTITPARAKINGRFPSSKA